MAGDQSHAVTVDGLAAARQSGGRQHHCPAAKGAGASVATRILMSRIVLGFLIAGALHAVSAAPAAAQTETREALRFESHWGTMRIVEGADGPVVGSAGVFRTANIEKILTGSPRAESEARLFRASHRNGAVATALGSLTFGAGLIASANSSSNAATPILMIGGLGAVFWGARQLDKSFSSLSRAVWWYNRDLGSR